MAHSTNTNIKLSNNLKRYLNRFNKNINFDYVIIAHDNPRTFTIDTENLNLNQITELIKSARDLESPYESYEKDTDTIDITIPRRKFNPFYIALGTGLFYVLIKK